MMLLTPEEKKRAEELAKELGTRIPGEISKVLWALPLLEALVKRVKELEAKVKETKK